MGKTLLELSSVDKVFSTDTLETRALCDVNFNIEEGEYLAITGASGCGKSTLMSVLGMLDVISKGTYVINGQDVSILSANERARYRNREIGFIFQSFNLISELSVEENIALPLTYRKDLKDTDIKRRVAEALEKVEMSHRAQHFPSQLSGGQQQRVAIARAIAGSPSILLADEPTGNLDSKNASSIMALFDELHSDGVTICMVTHDPASAARACRQIEMLDGKIVRDSLVKNVVNNSVA
ncbi:ABC transporter ATP-binding protein [Rheinheimera baltica]|uniref:ABC transporter ATP-binding protein n=1 Tax=Rheinheimera baltica TaxID=67576 RepID=UPI00040C6388|nr:ABC transporter ATP-binding protein [Rheinheimera baltica]